PDASTVALGDVSDDREPKAGPALAADARLVDLVEPLEDPADVAGRNADPVVLDRDDHLVAAGCRAHRDGCATRRELHRVMKKVDEHLAEPLVVAADDRRVSRQVGLEVDVLAIGEEPQSVDGAADDLAEVDDIKMQRCGALLDLREVEQLVHHLDEVAGFDVDLEDAVADA